MDMPNELGVKERREERAAELARQYGLPIDGFLALRAALDAAYDSGERNGRMVLLANQANHVNNADELLRLRAAVANVRDALKWAP